MANICRLSTAHLCERAQEHRSAAETFEPGYAGDPQRDLKNKLYADTQMVLATVYEELIERRTSQKDVVT